MENNIFTIMMADIRQLENENINLKIARGDYGFLAPGYGASIYSSIIKPHVTAEEYDLLRTFNINMPKDILVRCMNIIQRLIDDGVIDNPPYAYYNGYTPFMEKEEPPTPSYVGKPGSEFKLTPTNNTYNGEVIELTFNDARTVDDVHEQLKGTIDYAENNIILNREHKTMTVCVEALINPYEVMPIINRVITDMMVRGATKNRSTTSCDFKATSVSDCQFDLNGSPIIDDTDTTETKNETEE